MMLKKYNSNFAKSITLLYQSCRRLQKKRLSGIDHFWCFFAFSLKKIIGAPNLVREGIIPTMEAHLL